MSDAIRRNLAKEIAALEAELDAVTDQLITTIDNVVTQRLETRRDQIVEALERKQRAFSGRRQTPLQRDIDWQSVLHKVDYREVERLATIIKKAFGDETCAASFLIQQSALMGGKWCVNLLKEIFEVGSSSLPEYRIDFELGKPLTEQGLVDAFRLEMEQGLDKTGEAKPACVTEKRIESVIEYLCRQLKPGDTLFLEIAFDDRIAQSPEFLHWALDFFWQPLLERASAANHSLVNLIMVIVINKTVYEAEIPVELCCSRHACDSHGLKPLLLSHWTKEEIIAWLKGPAGMRALGMPGIHDLVQNCWDQGWPPIVVGNQLLAALGRL